MTQSYKNIMLIIELANACTNRLLSTITAHFIWLFQENTFCAAQHNSKTLTFNWIPKFRELYKVAKALSDSETQSYHHYRRQTNQVGLEKELLETEVDLAETNKNK